MLGRGRGIDLSGHYGSPLRRVDGQPSGVPLEENDWPARSSDRRIAALVSVFVQRLGHFGLHGFLRGCRFRDGPTLNANETRRTWPTSSNTSTARPKANGAAGVLPMGTPRPNELKYLEIENEETVDDALLQQNSPCWPRRFGPRTRMSLVVGDFLYLGRSPIRSISSGAASGNVASPVDRKILGLGEQHIREVWFDVHVGTEGPTPDSHARGHAVPILTPWTRSPTGRVSGGRLRLQRQTLIRSAAPSRMRLPSCRRSRRAIADRNLCQLPPGRRPERQRLESGPRFPAIRRKSGCNRRATSRRCSRGSHAAPCPGPGDVR